MDNAGYGSGIFAIADDPFQNIGYNDFYDNQGGNYILQQPSDATELVAISLPDGDGNISADPKLSNSYSLLSGSPCIDAGNPDAQYNDAALPPGLGAVRNDMGAYGGSENSEIEFVPSSILNHGFRSNIIVYPNPTTGNIFIKLGNTYNNVRVEIYTIAGQVIETRKMNTANQFNIEVNGQAGLYFISVQVDHGEHALFKVMKK
jgi:hypothetical protein